MMSAVFVVIGVAGGLIAGLGGPGGIPVIGLLYAQTSLSTAELAGTTSTIFAFATFFASLMYYYSGDIDWRLVASLIPSTLIGTFLGVQINPLVPREVFGLAVALLVVLIGLNVVYREVKGIEAYVDLSYGTRRGLAVISGAGFIVGVVGGVFGIGGPALSIPVLIFLGVPALQAIGAGLVQGIFVASSTATNYVLSGSISTETVLLVGPPYVIAQVAGWYTAQNMETRKLKIALGAMLACLGPYIAATI
jgi:uncharacterized membrane protein YfcA